MARTNGYSAEIFINNIPGTGGIITKIAEKVGCDWITAKKYVTEFPTINRVYQAECEGVLDLAEGQLIEAIKAGDLGAIKYLLSTKGRHRGFVEKQEISNEGEVTLIIKYGTDNNTKKASS